MPVEIEFKFKIADHQKERVLSGFGDGAAEAFDFETTYFDTPDLDLKSRGMQLRLRRDGDAIIQTFKSKSAKSGPFGREENEIRVADATLNLDHVAGQLPDDLKSEFAKWELRPQFRTKFHRISLELSNGDFVAEESYDSGDILADQRSSEISEVEIEFKAGSLPAYSAACLDFLDRVPSGLLLEGKAARGFRLAHNKTPDPVFANREPVSGDDALPDAILALLRRHFAHFLENHPAVVRGGAPEAIHQMRVGMRRLRAALQSFSPVLDLAPARGLLDEIRNLFALLGPIREADVFLAENLPAMRAAGLGAAKSDLLEREIVRFREQRFAVLKDALTGPDFARLVIRLNDWIEGRQWLMQRDPLDQLLTQRRVREFAATRLRSLQHKLFKKADKARAGTLDEWHETRIAAKKLRYASTPLIGALLDEADAAEYAERLSDLQDCLGELNDLNTIPAFLAQVNATVSRRKRAAFEAASEFCRGWSVGAAPAVIQQSDALLREFEAVGKKLTTGPAR